jgi:rhodanese-related sulfurtransferase
MFKRARSAMILPSDAAEAERRGALLLDVREAEEWEAGHAPGAVHLPLGAVTDAAPSLRGQQVLTVCRSGGRSARAASALATAGIDVRDVAGGMTAWAGAGLPVIRDDGTPGEVI